MNTDKKIGDYIVLFENKYGPALHLIESDPKIFKSNRLATEEEIKEYEEMLERVWNRVEKSLNKKALK